MKTSIWDYVMLLPRCKIYTPIYSNRYLDNVVSPCHSSQTFYDTNKSFSKFIHSTNIYQMLLSL